MAEYGIGSVTLNTGTNKVTAHNVTGALGGVLELWEDSKPLPVDEKLIVNDNFTWEFDQPITSTDTCCHVIAKEAFPSPNFDMKFVPGTNCPSEGESEVEGGIEIPATNVRKVSVNLNLPDYARQVVQVYILSKSKDEDYFNISDESRSFAFTRNLNGNGRIPPGDPVKKELEQGDTIAAILVVIPGVRSLHRLWS